ncbi:MAG: DNA polymerase III subunit delta' [Dehalococcoidia bacterium]
MWQIIGQDRNLALLDYSLKTDTVGHAYLLVGPRHVGKRTLALNLAQALNCDQPEPPCGQCRSCQRILEGKHADVTSIGLGSKTEIGIDDIRALQHLANLPPYEGKCKVFIIDDAEYLSSEAANALLKVLEEPPQRVVWILLAAEEERLLPTIVSRCQRLALKPVQSEQAQKILVNSYKVDADRASLLAQLCHGRFGWAVSALENDEMLEQRAQGITTLFSLLTPTGRSLGQRFAYAEELASQFSQDRRGGLEVMETWLDWWRDLLLIKGGCADAIVNADYAMDLEDQARGLSLSEIRDFLGNLCLLREEISKNVNPRLAAEWLMLNLPGRA